jgi:hypothetical protein
MVLFIGDIMTKGDLVKQLNLETRGAVDYALPQNWVNWAVRKLSQYLCESEDSLYPKVIGQFVMLYPKDGGGGFNGIIEPLTPDAGRLKFILDNC